MPAARKELGVGVAISDQHIHRFEHREVHKRCSAVIIVA
jgi:hypothetical protein